MGDKALFHVHTVDSRPEHDYWGTPKWRYYYYCNYFQIFPKLDVCASEYNHVCDDYYTVEDDMFTKKVIVPFYMNPFYSQIDECMEYAWNQHIENDVDALLCVNAQVGAGWYQKYIWKPFKESIKTGIKHVDIENHPRRIKFLDRFGNIPQKEGKDGVLRENSAMYWTSFVAFFKITEEEKKLLRIY